MKTINFKGVTIEAKETSGGKFYRAKGKIYWRRSLTFAYMVTKWKSEETTDEQRKMLAALRRSCRVG